MPPLGCVPKEGDRWRIEEWLEQIMREKDRRKEVKPQDCQLNLVTTIRSSSEEKERGTPGRTTRQRDSQGGKERGLPRRRRTQKKISTSTSPRRVTGPLQPEAKAGSRSIKGRRGHWTFHTASAGQGGATEKDEGPPTPLSAPWRVDARRIQKIQEAIQDLDDPIKEDTQDTKDPDQDFPANIEKHRVVEACMQVCWACEDYGQTVIQPSFIGCCCRPKHPPHAEHICTECIDEINKQMGGEDRSGTRNYEPSQSLGVSEKDSDR